MYAYVCMWKMAGDMSEISKVNMARFSGRYCEEIDSGLESKSNCIVFNG